MWVIKCQARSIFFVQPFTAPVLNGQGISFHPATNPKPSEEQGKLSETQWEETMSLNTEEGTRLPEAVRRGIGVLWALLYTYYVTM